MHGSRAARELNGRHDLARGRVSRPYWAAAPVGVADSDGGADAGDVDAGGAEVGAGEPGAVGEAVAVPVPDGAREGVAGTVPPNVAPVVAPFSSVMRWTGLARPYWAQSRLS